jgi:hypothetical protein
MKNMSNEEDISRYQSLDQGHIPLSKMAILSVEKMLQCLNEAGLTKSADLLKSECKNKKVNEVSN